MENLTIPENTTLVTMDVTSLYTNIPHDDGIAACRKRWEQRTVHEPPTECLVEMLTLVLKNNNFTFDGSHYLQINGTAMGTKMAPSYANIYMGDLAELLLLSSLKQPLSLFRFIDDVGLKWIHSDKELDEFFEHANSIHPSIKFTNEVSKTKLYFLDTTTTVNEGNMTTDLYSKPTDKHQYLSPSSCHPKHCFKSIPFSQAIRIRVKRICSTVETTKQRLGDLRHHLKRQGYNDKVIESGFSKASEIDRNDLLEYKEKKINKRVPLVLTYHPSLEKISGIVSHHWKEIQKSETLNKLFPESTVGQYKPCDDKRCKCCLQ
jgi:hypothetical protein